MKPSQILGITLYIIFLVALNIKGYIDWDGGYPEEWTTVTAVSVDVTMGIVVGIRLFLILWEKFAKRFDSLFKTLVPVVLVLSVVACDDSKSEPDRWDHPFDNNDIAYQMTLTVGGDTLVLTSPWIIKVKTINQTNVVYTVARDFPISINLLLVCPTKSGIKVLNREVLLVSPEVRDELKKIVNQGHRKCLDD